MPRSYTKRNESYWSQVSQSKTKSQEISTASTFEPESFGSPYLTLGSETALASTRSSSSERTGSRINRSTITPSIDRFSQIRQMSLPYSYKDGSVNMRDAVELTQKAYAGVATYKNAIDLMSEFSNTEIYLKGGNKASRDFFTRWFKRINLWALKKAYFLEYFRSSNIFLYRIDGKFTLEDFVKLSTVYAEEGGLSNEEIPLAYLLLNTYDMVTNNTSVFYEGMYEKVLSSQELARLKNPITDEDKQLFDNLPQDAKDLISKRSWTSQGIRIKLDPKKIHTSFAKKQPYEPFAIPFGWSVLEDINAKLEMKRADQAIMRTVENVILLIKTGEPKNQYGGGINQNNINALRELFMNGTTGRTLVADYSTTAEFILPDLKKVLGPEKYQILNQDIREGLQNIIVGEEKYGNTQAKINVFIEKLREARNSFLNDILQPEIKRIAKIMGFRVYPSAFFTDLELQDNTEMMRIANRLTELGILTPKQLMEVFQNGQFPNSEEIELAQDSYLEERKAGKWNPLSPVPVVPAPAPLLDPNKAQSASSPKKAKTPGSAGRPSGSTASVSIDAIKEITLAANNLENYIIEQIKTSTNSKKLTKDQKSLARELTEKVVASSEPIQWKSTAEECVKNPNKIMELVPPEQVQVLAAESGLNDFAAALYVWAAE